MWKAPPECPTHEAIEAQVGAWIHGELPSHGELSVQATAGATAESWTVHIIVQGGGSQGERLVTTRTCADAAQLVAIAAALAIAPGDDSIPRVDETPSTGPNLGEPGTKREDPAPSSSVEAGSAPNEAVRDEKRPIPWSVSMGALAGSGLLPGVRGALTLGGGVQLGGLGISVGALWFPTVATAGPSGTAPIDMTAVGGGATLSYLWGAGGFFFGPSFGGEAGAVVADQEGDGAGRSATAAPWLLLLVGGRVRIPLYKSVKAALGADLVLPVIRPDLILDDGTPVYRADVGARGLLEISLEFNHTE